MYYFAYGSNMNREQMKKRCPTGRFLKRARLLGYKFVYDGHSSMRNGAVANIIKSENGTVWGVIFEIDDECIKNLDRYEGFPRSYQRRCVGVDDEGGNTYQAVVYLRKPQEIGKPSDEYRDILLEGARDCGLPESYIKDFLKL